jgi:hypothetical protein
MAIECRHSTRESAGRRAFCHPGVRNCVREPRLRGPDPPSTALRGAMKRLWPRRIHHAGRCASDNAMAMDGFAHHEVSDGLAGQR